MIFSGCPEPITGAIIGAFINTAVQGATGNLNSSKDFFKAMAVGALSGAAGAGVGGVVSNAINVGGFLGGAITGSAGGAAGGFVGSASNAWFNGANFGDGLKQGLVGAGTGALIGGVTGGLWDGFGAMRKGNSFWDGFDFQAALDKVVVAEGINNPNSEFLVANRKNAKLVNETFRTTRTPEVTKVRGNKIYNLLSDEISDLGMNFGTQSKGNISLVSKQAIRGNATFGLRDVVIHEGMHQAQVLAGMRNARIMEYGAYMTNIRTATSPHTIQRIMNILINDWGFDQSNLWEVILNLNPNGPIP